MRLHKLKISLVLISMCTIALHAVEPVNPDLIPEARTVLNYLESVYGTKTIGATNGGTNNETIYERIAKDGAIQNFDACGWRSNKWDATYIKERREAAAGIIALWKEKGAIPTITYHWGNPMTSHMTYDSSKNHNIDKDKMVIPGTTEYERTMLDIVNTGKYFLDTLMTERVPVLWRPLHEIDGGWFWWTDTKNPENTAKLWRMMFDHYVKERKLHNLIWVYSAALKCGEGQKAGENVDLRKQYYPGSEYVDISGIDIYPNGYWGWGDYKEDTYIKAFDVMTQVSPGKMLALCECSHIPNPDTLKTKGPRWLYALPWFVSDLPWTDFSYQHEHILTLDEIPDLNPNNQAPAVFMISPVSDSLTYKSTIRLSSDASDREGAVAKVTYYASTIPYETWWWSTLREAYSKSLVEIGSSTTAPFSFDWTPDSADYYSLTAKATDGNGAEAWSNNLRVGVGLNSLALNKKSWCSSDSVKSAQAFDNDMMSSAYYKKEWGDTHWVAVDLGAKKNINAISLYWDRTMPSEFKLEVSDDTVTWKSFYSTNKTSAGLQRLLLDQTVTGRYFRIYMTKRKESWGGYTLRDFGIYEKFGGKPDATKAMARSMPNLLNHPVLVQHKGELAFKFQNPVPESARLAIFSADGRKVFESAIGNRHSLSVSRKFAAGIYYWQIATESNTFEGTFTKVAR